MPQVRIGVDIGSTGVRAAELSMRSVPPQLVRVAQVPIPDGAVGSGEVRDPAAVADALRELWHRGKFRSRDVILGVANQRVVVREVALPWLTDKELRVAALPGPGVRPDPGRGSRPGLPHPRGIRAGGPAHGADPPGR